MGRIQGNGDPMSGRHCHGNHQNSGSCLDAYFGSQSWVGSVFSCGIDARRFFLVIIIICLSSDVKADTLTLKRVSNVFFQRFFVRGFPEKI
jgi:hypothetical protein